MTSGLNGIASHFSKPNNAVGQFGYFRQDGVLQSVALTTPVVTIVSPPPTLTVNGSVPGLKVTSQSAQAFTVDSDGTNPAFQVSTYGGSADGLKITASGAGFGLAIAAISTAANTSLLIDSKGTGNIVLGSGSTGNITLSRPVSTGSTLGVNGNLTVTSSNASAMVVSKSGLSNAFQVDTATASAITGLKITSAASGAGLALALISSSSNENLTIDALGTGTITFGATSTGNVLSSRPIVVTSQNANALTVGRQGTTNPAFQVDSNTASSATGIKVTAAAAAADVVLEAISSGSNENLSIRAKGTASIFFGVGGGSTQQLLMATPGNFGYVTGVNAGGSVTQTTSRTTGVTINKPTGAITLVSAAGSTTIAAFTVTNNTVAATDVIKVVQKSGTDKYRIYVTNVAAGTFEISFATLSGTTTEQPVFNFFVLKGSAN